MPDNLQINPNKEVLISVCIATYKRPALLEKLLLSLTKQDLPSKVKLEIVVTDNDIETSAKNILGKFADTENICFKYFIQPEKNISLTRNMCVVNSKGDFICFIDDDETADKNWINNLLSCVYKFNADAVFGYVEPVFDSRISDKFKNREFYFTPVVNTGSIAQYYYTTNCIIKSKLIKKEGSLFDPNYGLTGGEDVHLFENLANKGAKYISCKEAITYEFIPQNRGNYNYLFNRALRGGQSYLRRSLEHRKNLLFKITSIIKIFLQFLFSIFLFSLFPYSRKKSVMAIILMGDAIGKSRAMLFKFKKIY